jgi:predicted ribosome quality control (RQC) complex YloA/Tae2 family protein
MMDDKTGLTALDIHYLVQEFQNLVGSRVDSIYQKEDTLFIIFHKSGEGKIILKIMIPNFIYITTYKEEMSKTPPQFCSILRKHLKTARLREITQISFERILSLKFETKDKIYFLIIELFSKGNIILCNSVMKIVYPMTHQKWKDRLIKGGQEYLHPKKELNPFSLTEKQLNESLHITKMDSVVTFLAKEIGFGGKYSEQICKEAGIDKKSHPKNIDAKKLFEIIRSFMNSPVKINDSLNSALTKKTIKQAEDNKEKEHKEKKSKVDKILTSQKEISSFLEDSIRANNSKGDWIYQNYTEVNQIIDDFRKIRKKHSWKEIKERLKGNNKIIAVDEKTGKITLNFN